MFEILRTHLTQSDEAPLEDECDLPLSEIERRHAARVLARVGGNKVRAAQIVGINRATLARIVARQLSE